VNAIVSGIECGMLFSMTDCIFCKIISGDIPSNKVYEDEYTVAFLDANPNAPGHTLVVPKRHVVNIFDTDEETLSRTMAAIRKIAPAVRDGVDAHGVHVNSNHGTAAGQVVFHLHFHIIPRHERSEFSFWPKDERAAVDAKTIAEQIRSKLS